MRVSRNVLYDNNINFSISGGSVASAENNIVALNGATVPNGTVIQQQLTIAPRRIFSAGGFSRYVKQVTMARSSSASNSGVNSETSQPAPITRPTILSMIMVEIPSGYQERLRPDHFRTTSF
jgi:hypothetical protein